MPEVSVILPTRNERSTLGPLIDEIGLLPYPLEIIVADYRSTDGTRDIALEKRVYLLDVAKKGKGAALIEAFSKVLGEYIVVLDADGTYFPRDIESLVTLLKGGYGCVLGQRQYRLEGAMSRVHSLGNYLHSLTASILYLRRVRDVNTGMRGFRRAVLSRLSLSRSDFTIEAEIFTELVKKKVLFVETPIVYGPRPKEDKAKLSFWDGFKIEWYLVKRRFS